MKLKKKRKLYNGLFEDFGIKTTLSIFLIGTLYLMYAMFRLIIAVTSLKTFSIALIAFIIAYALIHVSEY